MEPLPISLFNAETQHSRLVDVLAFGLCVLHWLHLGHLR